MKMKTYTILKSGSTQCGTIKATCISNACRQYILTLVRPYGATWNLDSTSQARIRYSDNFNVMSDYVIIESK